MRFAIYGAIALVLAAGLGLWLARETATEEARENAYLDTRAIADRLAGDDLASLALQRPVGGEERIDLDELFRQQTLDDGIVRVTLYDRNGRITYSTEHLLIGAQGDQVRVRRVIDGEEWFGRTRLEDRSDVMASYVPVRWLHADPGFT